MTPTQTRSRIDWVGANCRLLRGIAQEFAESRPFEGLTIATAIHLEPKTAALLLTLRAGGASVISTGNLNSTQPATVDYLRHAGVQVIGEQTTSVEAHEGFLDALYAREPDLILDNGGDLFARAARRGYAKLRGGTEETTSGRMRLAPLREAIGRPVLVINDSPIKQFAENRLAVGQSLFESYLRFTNRSANGKRALLFGYGACGRGVAAAFRAGQAVTSVVDCDPVMTLEAHLDGFLTPKRDEALRSADIVITVTGAANVVTAADLALLKDGALLINGGHLPQEIAVEALRADASVAASEIYPTEGIETLTLHDGRRAHILGGGHMANLAGPRPLGNSIEAMDLGFALQARCLERVAHGGLGAEHCVVPVPRDIDAAVATAYLDLWR